MPSRPAQRLGQVGHTALGEDPPAPAAGQDGGDPVGGEVRFERQVAAARLEHADHGGQPLQAALGDHGDHVLAVQPPAVQRPGDLVGVAVQFPVAPSAVPQDGGDRVGVTAYPLLEQLVEPAVREGADGPGESSSWRASSARTAGSAGRARRPDRRTDQGERGEVVAGEPRGGVPGVEHLGPVPQPQHRCVAIGRRATRSTVCSVELPDDTGSGRVRSRNVVGSLTSPNELLTRLDSSPRGGRTACPAARPAARTVSRHTPPPGATATTHPRPATRPAPCGQRRRAP